MIIWHSRRLPLAQGSHYIPAGLARENLQDRLHRIRKANGHCSPPALSAFQTDLCMVVDRAVLYDGKPKPGAPHFF